MRKLLIALLIVSSCSIHTSNSMSLEKLGVATTIVGYSTGGIMALGCTLFLLVNPDGPSNNAKFGLCGGFAMITATFLAVKYLLCSPSATN